MRCEEGGAAVTLAIFTIFVILCSVLALHTFEAGYQRQLSMVQQRMATDTTRAVAATVESELNYALRTAFEAAMYDAGKVGGDKDYVKNLFFQYFDNYQIENRWSYSNFESIYVPIVDNVMFENMLAWLPDGSLRVRGYLDNACFTHVMGARAYGVKLDAGVVPRYGRMLHIAYYVWENYRDENGNWVMGEGALENELNDNYACEYLSFEIRQNGLTVHDNYAGRAIAAD